MSFNDLTTSKKLMAGFAGVVGISVIMSIAIYLALGSIETATAANNLSQSKLRAADTALSALVEQQNAVRGFVASGDESFLKTFKTKGEAFTTALQTLSSLSAGGDETGKLDTLKQNAETVWSEEQAQINGRRDPTVLAGVQASIATTGRLTGSRETLKSITEPEQKLMKARSAAQGEAFSTARLTLLAGGAIGILVSTLVGWMLTLVIATPVAQMTGAMNKLAAGDNDVEIPAVGRRDEVGQMADAVHMFKVVAIEKIRLASVAEQQRLDAQRDRERTVANDAETVRHQFEVVTSLASGLEKLSAGVLTFRIDHAFAPQYEKLRFDYNDAMRQLQDTMKTVAANTASIRSGTSEITLASDDLSRRTEQQAASLEETAAALDEITATVRTTAHGVNEARNVVSASKSDAENSGIVVRDAVAAMSEIELSSTKISQIIGVIDEIAFQTNLLALNAGVEAARAGDAGKGFAVVASEVRALAQRSAEAAKEIKALISLSSQQVGRGVSLVGETGKALERIVIQVTQINGVIAEIAASAQEQATGLAEVNTAINQMDQVIQQNAAMVEQSTAANHALAQETEELARLIARFEIGEAERAEPMRTRPQPEPVAITRQPIAQMRTTGGRRGSAAHVRQTAAADGAWNEF